MTKAKIFGILASTVTVAATYTGAAQAADGEGYGSVGALLGVGFVTSSNTADINPAGFGLGVRGGYTLPMNVYLGGTFVYHFGGSESFPGGDASYNMFYFGVEGGYDIAAGPVIVRPYLGLGDVVGHFSMPGINLGPLGATPPISESSGAFGLWPGVAVLYPIDNFFVGGDARFVIATGDNSDFSEFSIFATGGLKF
jgi:hypothetical protein